MIPQDHLSRRLIYRAIKRRENPGRICEAAGASGNRDALGVTEAVQTRDRRGERSCIRVRQVNRIAVRSDPLMVVVKDEDAALSRRDAKNGDAKATGELSSCRTERIRGTRKLVETTPPTSLQLIPACANKPPVMPVSNSKYLRIFRSSLFGGT